MGTRELLGDVGDWPGRTVVDRDGNKVGKVDDVYFDNDTQAPEWARVNTGLFGMRQTIVPLARATLLGEDVQVPYEKDQIKDAPNVEADNDLSQDEESTLARHYGLQYSKARSDSGLPERSGGKPRASEADRTGQPTDDAMTRSEEELDVSKTQRPSELVRLKKRVVTENQQVTVPVQHEEVRVEREPITDANRDEALSGPEITESEHEITLNEEEVVVGKRTVPKERVRLDKDTVTEQQTVDEPLRKERIDVERENRR